MGIMFIPKAHGERKRLRLCCHYYFIV